MFRKILKYINGIILFWLITTLFSCKKYDDLPENRKFMYKTGDTLIYRGNMADYDTFVINYVNYSYYVTDKTHYREICEIRCDYDGNDTSDSLFFINNTIELSNAGFIVEWGDFVYGSIDTIFSRIIINNIEFDNVYALENDPDLLEKNEIHKIWFSRKYGVLKYFYTNREDMEFYKVLE